MSATFIAMGEPAHDAERQALRYLVEGLPASRDRIHTRKTILAALQDPALVERLSGRRSLLPSTAAERDLLRLLTGVQQQGPRPVRRLREYEIVETLHHQETFTELLGRNSLSSAAPSLPRISSAWVPSSRCCSRGSPCSRPRVI